MKLSYVIPLYNAEQYLMECLDSVLNTDLEQSEYEIIVVDDGSMDNGLAVAQEYSKRYPNIRVLHEENQGLSVARNYGMSVAKGDYLWFVDSDDYVDATHMSSLLNMVIEKEIEICKFGMKVFRADGTSWLDSTANVEYDEVYSGEQVLCGGILVGSVCNSLFCRKFILDNNLTFYPGIYHQDAEFSLRATALVKRTIYVNQHIYVYRYNGDSSTRSKDFNKILKSHISDAIIARNIHEFVRQSDYLSDNLKVFLDNHATSIIKGRLVSYLINRDVDSMKLYNAFVEKAASLGEYPMVGKNSRFIDKMQFFFLNSDSLMSCVVKLRNIH